MTFLSRFLLVGFVALLFISVAPLAVAQECGSVPTDRCVVTQTTTFTPGTYSLPNGINFAASFVTLDCNGATLQGSGLDGSTGITLNESVTDITIKNCVIHSYIAGMELDFGNISNSVFQSNTIKNNLYGMRMSTNINTVETEYSFNNMITSNSFLFNEIDALILSQFSNTTITNNIFEGTSRFALYVDGPYTLIDGNTFNNTGTVTLHGSMPPEPISANSTVTNNDFTKHSDIVFDGVFDSLISGNTIDQQSTAQVGITLKQSARNEVVGNTISGSTRAGMDVMGGMLTSNDNFIHENNFKDNAISAQDFGAGNRWNTSLIGNYWSDYDTAEEGCADSNVDNICDSPYTIAGGLSQDALPQTGLFSTIPPPSLDAISPITVDESGDVVVVVNAESSLPLDYSIDGQHFVQDPVNENIFTWQTNFADAGGYLFTVVVTDSNNLKR